MFVMFPLLSLPMIAYAVLTMLGMDLGAAVFSPAMASGETWVITGGDLLLIFGLLMLFIEMVKASDTGQASIVNHGLTMLVFIASMALFLLAAGFASSVFFQLMLMALINVIAGFIITIVAARRDLAMGGGG